MASVTKPSAVALPRPIGDMTMRFLTCTLAILMGSKSFRSLLMVHPFFVGCAWRNRTLFNPLCPPFLGEEQVWDRGTPSGSRQRGFAPLHTSVELSSIVPS